MQHHPILDFWARAVPPGLPEPPIIDGEQYAGHEFHEFASPYIALASAPTIPLTEWWREERRIKDAFKAVYPQSPPHPDRASTSSLFLRDTRRLIGRLVRVAYDREAQRTAAVHLAAEAVIRDAMQPLLATEYLSAWLGLPAWQVYDLGAGWSRQLSEESMLYHNDMLAATGQVWWGHLSSYDDSGEWNATTPLHDNAMGWGGTGLSTMSHQWGTDNSWPDDLSILLAVVMTVD
ncbi:hypothetical protein B0H16DRAFT_1718381 [Mycena metata]|uniref:Uncharacterized protein n=1 Tax=Mycena metata TaxID=1033252 RepID=A0AAD7JHV8_9AGAR|nr:hypothetical protein B0H16DRAFT_1718381 [Mycena metata]